MQQTVKAGAESKKDSDFRSAILDPLNNASRTGGEPLTPEQLKKFHDYITFNVGRVSLPLLSEALEGVATLASRQFIAERFNGESFKFPHIMDVLYCLQHLIHNRRVELTLFEKGGETNDLRSAEIGAREA